MRNTMWVAMIVALGVLPLWAAERGGPGPGPGIGDREGGPGQPPGRPPGPPPDGGFGDRQGGPGMQPGPQPGPQPGMPGGGMFDPLGPTVVFDAARQALALPADTRKSIDQLDGQFVEELQAAITEARLKLSKDYVAKVMALLPDEEKPKYEAVAKALTGRDEVLAAAQKELKAALDLIKAAQAADPAPRADRRRRGGPPGGSQTSKVDILRTHFVLTGPQQAAVEEAQRESFDAMRERMQGLFAGLRGQPGGNPDPNAFRRMGQAMARIRDEVDDATGKTAAEFLTAEQKKDYATACFAIDTARTKVKVAEEVCRAKIVDAVGVEKANALLGPAPGTLAEPK